VSSSFPFLPHKPNVLIRLIKLLAHIFNFLNCDVDVSSLYHSTGQWWGKIHSSDQGRIKVWQFGQLPGPPDFWGPPNHRFHLYGPFVWSLTCKKFACGAILKFVATVSPPAPKFKKIAYCGASILKLCLRHQNSIFFCKFFACVVTFPMAIMRLFAHHRFLGGPTNGLPRAPENLNPALLPTRRHKTIFSRVLLECTNFILLKK
jgi:hypothetical protein